MAFARAVLFLILMTLFALAGVVLALYTPNLPAEMLEDKYGPPPSQIVQLGSGQRLHLRDEGPRDAPAIVLMHDGADSLHAFELWALDLSANYRVISFDAPGHGLTGPAFDGQYGPTAMASIVEQVRTGLKLETVILVGQGMGGETAWTYALMYPQHVSALVLIAPKGAPTGTDVAHRTLGTRLAHVPLLNHALRYAAPRALIADNVTEGFADPSFATPSMIDRQHDLLRFPGNRAATIARTNGASDGFPFDRIVGISAPTLILWGKQDIINSPAAATDFTKLLPNASLKLYDNVGHYPQIEAARASVEDVRVFLLAKLGPPLPVTPALP